MKYFNRIKPRQTGKTMDLIDLACVLLEIGRKVVIIVNHNNTKTRVSTTLRDFGFRKVHVVLDKNFDRFIRGHRFDTFLIDEYNSIPLNHQTTIKTNALIMDAYVYSV